MAETLALEKLYDDVRALFTGEGTICTHTFGWRTPANQRIGTRIAWVPGDPRGNAGEDAPARNVGRNPRPIATLRELFTCYISADDPDDPENEALQYRATRLLYDAWRRAMYLSAHGTFAIRSTSWEIDKNERRRGACIVCVVALEAMIPDEPLVSVPVDTKIHLTTTELDASDEQDISPADVP
jgi:hypothetical protein